MKPTSAVVSLVLLAGHVAAFGVNLNLMKARSSLLARQVGGLGGDAPSQCETTCAILTTLEGCSTGPCICTSANMIDLENCMDCIFTVEPNPDLQAQTQVSLDQLTSSCDAEDLPVPSISIVPSGGAPVTTPPASAPGSSPSPSGTGVFNTNSPSVTFDPTTTPTTSPTSSSSSSSTSSSRSSPSPSPGSSGPASGGSGGALNPPNAAVANTGSGLLLAAAVGAVLLGLSL